jgi:hypothetical protein
LHTGTSQLGEEATMGGLKVAVVGAFVGAMALAGCGGGGSTATSGTTVLASGCATGSGITASTTTQSYVVRLDIGPLETMFTPAQAASQHPTDGEIMISGTMSPVGGSDGMGDMPGMSGSDTSGTATNTSAHHLEAHICSKTSGTPIQGANPTITVTPAATPSTPQNVPIAVMEGVNAGVADYHYGNNVLLSPGGAYTVAVALNGQTATFHITIPAA